MAILQILQYPDERLHKVAKPVSTFDKKLSELIRDMAETMYAAPGIGLAATQVDVHQRLMVIDISEQKNALMVFINPELVRCNGQIEGEEGCLSVPGIYDKVSRAETIQVKAQKANGEWFTLDADGLLAVCIQHEMDHLNGKVFVEHLSSLKQNRIRTKLKKRRREAM